MCSLLSKVIFLESIYQYFTCIVILWHVLNEYVDETCYFYHCLMQNHLSRGTAFPTRLHVRPARTKINLCRYADLSETSLSIWRCFGLLTTHRVSCEDSEQAVSRCSVRSVRRDFQTESLKPEVLTKLTLRVWDLSDHEKCQNVLRY